MIRSCLSINHKYILWRQHMEQKPIRIKTEPRLTAFMFYFTFIEIVLFSSIENIPHFYWLLYCIQNILPSANFYFFQRRKQTNKNRTASKSFRNGSPFWYSPVIVFHSLHLWDADNIQNKSKRRKISFEFTIRWSSLWNSYLNAIPDEYGT